ncbi:MAG: hypothetical protein ACOY4D_07230 [Pseudomonadota bacterium]
MIRNPRTRRIISFALVTLGGVLMFFAPETEEWAGMAVLALGVLIEIIGISIEHKDY